MGGSIAIAARFNDGQAICVDGWTNFIPDMVMNETTLSGDDAVVRRTLLEVAEHEHYEGPQPFRAQGYGMVAIDFVAREIHSMQGYTSFTRKGLVQMRDLGAGSGWREGLPEEGITHPLFPGKVFVSTIKEEAGTLIDAGRISKVAVDGEPCDPEVLTRQDVLHMLSRDMCSYLGGDREPYVDLRIDTAPFIVQDHPEGGSLAAMKARLREVGFPLTAADGLNAMLRRK